MTVVMARCNVESQKQPKGWFLLQADFTLSLVCILATLPEIAVSAETQECEPTCLEKRHPMNVYWGDTHLHSSLSSWDAYAWGNRLGLKEAYRFAKGEVVIDNNGRRARLHRPLDFLVIADHAEDLGVMVAIDEDASALADISSERLLRLQQYRDEFEKFRPILNVPTSDIDFDIYAEANTGELIPDSAFKRSVWQEVTATADRYNEPGKFTAFIGYEWTSAPGGGNLHRVLVFKDDAEYANQIIPFSKYDSEDPQDLWAFMESYELQTGGEMFAIPHNGNTSLGQMFSLSAQDGRPLTAEVAKMSNRWERLYEVTQVKGTSEAHPFLSPNDEFANFEIWNSWLGDELFAGQQWDDNERKRKQGEYARAGLKRGLQMQEELGINPYKFGLIGSTDSHNSLSAVEEDNFGGKFAVNALGMPRLSDDITVGTSRETDSAAWQAFGVDRQMPPARKLGATGYAAVWALENTREALFAAMKRRETYATTGPRMTVRFFGGWDFSKEDALRPDLASLGYEKGVPMGQDLTDADGKSPTFLIRAVKDPLGANLDRVQLIKGWVAADGELHETIYEVALADGRTIDADGKVLPVGNTVNIKQATYINSIGDVELATVWTDPDFEPEKPAFYYLRVLEIPTPRWSTYDAALFNVAPPEDVPATIQERAYTSPIWYVPSNNRQSF